MAWDDVEAAIEPGTSLVIDSSVVLAYLDGTERISELAAGVFDRLVRPGRNPATLSAISVTEVLVRPMRAASTGATSIVETFLLTFPNLAIEPVSFAIAREAAAIRAATALRAPDAIVLASAIVTGSAVVSNDDLWAGAVARSGRDVQLVHLAAYATS